MYIGGQGITNKNGENYAQGGFNGGGRGAVGTSNHKVGSGGGATDIRIGCKTLGCRKIVAGGGGGAGAATSSTTQDVSFGGSGGGIKGTDGNGYDSLTDNYKGTGATQTGPGKGGTLQAKAEDGKLGIGGALECSGKCFSSSGGGGGGGYYGGSAGANRGENGGGGSGFIDSSFTKTNGITPTTLDGTKSFPRSTLLDSGNETGHEGNGAVRITKLSPARTFGQTIGRTLFQTFAPTQTRTAIPRHIYELCFAIVRNSERDSCIASGKKKFLVTMCQVMLIGLK